MKKSSLIISMLLVFALGVGCGFGLGGVVNNGGSTSAPSSSAEGLNYNKVNELWNIIQKDYYR